MLMLPLLLLTANDLLVELIVTNNTQTKYCCLFYLGEFSYAVNRVMFVYNI